MRKFRRVGIARSRNVRVILFGLTLFGLLWWPPLRERVSEMDGMVLEGY